ncbi:agmatine deiminase [Streptomyces sp. NPDC047000]|uniref:agmatine deiminase n=1 Tax=Streptomyces sp. NPDC047000 TaxID=3155474 RepID=UPI0033E810D1
MGPTLDSTPAADGYRMPAEWAHHSGCWLVWPERPDNWRLGGKPAQRVFAEVATAVAQTEKVTVLVSAAQYDNARSRLPAGVRVVEMSSDDSWMRDTGPTFVTDGTGDVRGVDWDFNAWGGLVDGLYFPWANDDAVARKVLEIEELPRYKAHFVLEGGSIDVDGEGTVLVTEECLLSEGRNPGLTKDEIGQRLRDYLGAEKVIWLPFGVYLDETNGHVDNFCRFAAPGKVMLTWTDDVNDPQYKRSQAALEVLLAETDARGRRLEVVRIHQPGPILITEEESNGVDTIEGTLPRQTGDRLAGSYVNSYIGNDVVILPVFDDPHDQDAVAAYTELFAPRRVVTVPGREILLGGGNVHCITQQQPSGR